MAETMTQEKVDALIRKYGIRECHVQVDKLSKKKLAHKIRELIARCKAAASESKAKEQQQQPAHESEQDEEQHSQSGDPAVPDPVTSKQQPDNVRDSSPDSGIRVHEEEEEEQQPHDNGLIPDTVYADTTDDSPAETNTHTDDHVNTEKVKEEAADSHDEEEEVRDESYFMRMYNIDPDWPQLVLERLDPLYIDWMLRDKRTKTTIKKEKKPKVKKEKKQPAKRKRGRKANASDDQSDETDEVHEEDKKMYTPESDPEYTEDPEELEIDDQDDDEDGTPDDLVDEDFCPDEPKAKRQRKAAAGTSGTSKNSKSKPERRSKSCIKMHHCDKCAFSTSNGKDLKNHVASHGVNMEPMFTCVPCNVQFFTRKDYEIHEYESHGGSDKLPRAIFLHCKSCMQTFEGVKDFDNHIVYHIRPVDSGYQCAYENCQFGSTKYAPAAEHVKTHIHYKCTFCDKVMPKMKMLEQHCSREHKQFGLPFRCDMCDARTSVFGLLVEHKEETHGILIQKDAEICRFCGIETNYVFSSNFIEKIAHLSIHADFSERLYKCKHMGCNFTAGNLEAFSDHNLMSHIADALDEEEISCEADVEGLNKALIPAIKNKFRKQPAAERTKPNPQETDSAVDALLGILTPPDEECDEQSSNGAAAGFCIASGDMELDSVFIATQNHSSTQAMDGQEDMMDINALPLFDSS